MERQLHEYLTTIKYKYVNGTRKDALNAIRNFTSLSVEKDTLLMNNGMVRTLVCLDGTIPVMYRGIKYNIPIRVWLQTLHPYSPPICYVRPMQTMAVKVSKHVDQSGLIYLPYLHEWKHPVSDLSGLLQVMCIVFGERPPVYSLLQHSDERPKQWQFAHHKANCPLPHCPPNFQSPVSSGLLTARHNQSHLQLPHGAVAKERREKEELQQELPQEPEKNRDNIQKELDEARHKIIQVSEEKEHVQRLLSKELREKTNIEERLSDAEQVIERNKVLNIPSHDIELTDTELGRGSYGAVCVGYWRGCPVAVKVLYDHLAAVPRNIKLVRQEASVAWKVHHPNIATVCGVTLELEEKKAWIIMELHSGSMSGVIDACHGDVAPLTLREKVDMTHDSLCGLDYIHNMKPMEILHGDLCPRNILVTAMMRAKLGDLGGARFQDASLSVGLLSPQYTAPERFESQPKSKKTDMYSIGVTICELFTADPPDRQQRMDQIFLIREQNVRSLCKQLMKDDPAIRPTAAEARIIISGICKADDYIACPPKRMVKGKMDGIADVTLIQPIW